MKNLSHVILLFSKLMILREVFILKPKILMERPTSRTKPSLKKSIKCSLRKIWAKLKDQLFVKSQIMLFTNLKALWMSMVKKYL